MGHYENTEEGEPLQGELLEEVFPASIKKQPFSVGFSSARCRSAAERAVQSSLSHSSLLSLAFLSGWWGSATGTSEARMQEQVSDKVREGGCLSQIRSWRIYRLHSEDSKSIIFKFETCSRTAWGPRKRDPNLYSPPLSSLHVLRTVFSSLLRGI